MLLILTVLLAGLLAPTQDSSWREASELRCGHETLLIGVIDQKAQVFASCDSEGDETLMRISVQNQAKNFRAPLREFSIGFCGPNVIGGAGPTGWTATVEDQETITYSLVDELADELGVPSGRRESGFVVRLRGGWRRSGSDRARWGERIVASFTSHACL